MWINDLPEKPARLPCLFWMSPVLSYGGLVLAVVLFFFLPGGDGGSGSWASFEAAYALVIISGVVAALGILLGLALFLVNSKRKLALPGLVLLNMPPLLLATWAYIEVA